MPMSWITMKYAEVFTGFLCLYGGRIEQNVGYRLRMNSHDGRVDITMWLDDHSMGAVKVQ